MIKDLEEVLQDIEKAYILKEKNDRELQLKLEEILQDLKQMEKEHKERKELNNL